jgi:hypothetical protein
MFLDLFAYKYHNMENLLEFFQTNRNVQYRYTPSSDYFWITQTGQIPYLKLQLTAPWSTMLAEASALESLYVPHRDDGLSLGWSSLCLHGINATQTDVGTGEYKWTEIAAQCPVTTEFFKRQFPFYQYQRIRFMRLAPGGYITPHADGNNFVLSAVNISLNNPAGCEMVVEGVGVVPFDPEGSALAFNTSYRHAVWNQSNHARYHIIVHGEPKPAWIDLVTKSYAANL